MEIQKTNNVQFGAKALRHVKLIENNENKIKASFIKFNTGCKRDIKALEEIETLWKGKNLSSEIAEEVRISSKTLRYRNIDNSQVLRHVTTGDITLGKNTKVFKPFNMQNLKYKDFSQKPELILLCM